MIRKRGFVLAVTCVLFSISFVQCFDEIQTEDNSKFLTSLIDHLNHLPDQSYKYDDGVLISAQKKEDNIHDIVADINVSCDGKPCAVDTLKCHSRIRSNDGSEGLQVLSDETTCQPRTQTPKPDAPTAGSGEQFVAVRRVTGGGGGKAGEWCAGCPTDINVNAEGVDDLAHKAIQHLERHRPQETHTLKSVLRIQRQAQIVNGVRYILLLDVDSASCETKSEDGICQNEKTINELCQVTFLEKPWLKLSDGSKFRAVMANNCTEEYLFGNDGEVLPPDNKRSGSPADKNDLQNELDSNADDNLKVVYTHELQASRPEAAQEITADRLKDVQEQIITEDSIANEQSSKIDTSFPLLGVPISQEVVQQSKQNPIEQTIFNPTSDVYRSPTDFQTQIDISGVEQKPLNGESDGEYVFKPLSEEKKQALDAMLGLFGMDLFEPQAPLTKRQIADDLKPKDLKSSGKQQNSSESSESSETKKGNGKKSVKKDSSEENSSSEETKEKPVPPQSRRRRSAEDKSTINRLAKLAVDTLDDYDSDNLKRVVLQVLNTKKSTRGSATEYHMKIKVGFSKCLESHENSDECLSMLTGDESKVCYVTIQVKETGEEKVLKSQCINKAGKNRDNRTKRQIVGAPSEVDLDNPEILKLAKIALNEFDLTSGSSNNHIVVKLISATRQVVSGIMTALKFEAKESDCSKSDILISLVALDSCGILENTQSKICTASVWDRPWIVNGRQVNVACEISSNSVHLENESKQLQKKKPNGKDRNQPPLIGGPVEVDLDDPEILNLAKIALNEFDLTSDTLNNHIVAKLVSATRQVVAGSMTVLKFEAKESKCPKSDEKLDSLDSCKILENALSKFCTAKIWDRPWIKNSREIDVNCETDNNTVHREGDEKPQSKKWQNNKTNQKYRTKRQLVGAPIGADLNDPKFLNLAKVSLGHYDLTSATSNSHIVVKLITATKQVVAGTKTRLTFEAIESKCSKLDKNTAALDSCEVLENAPGKICTASIWDRPWLKDGREIDIKCEIDNNSNRRKRAVADEPISKKLSKKLIAADKKFIEFLAKHDKIYDTPAEYVTRFTIFQQNLKFIDSLNNNEQGTAKYGATRFADLTYDEFKKYHLGLRTDLSHANHIPMAKANIPDVADMPVEFDWRDQGAVTPVKNQGSCGSCWAFSVTGNVEGQWKIKSGNLLSLSEQELVDCDKLDEGCNGGLPDNAYRAIEELGGLELENDYPYDAQDETCHFNKTLSRVQISGAVNISTNETDMQKWLLQNGPISIGINANAMQFYMGGVSHPFKFLCNPGNLDHGVLIVGYGVHKYPLFNKIMPYWIVKNSWGPSWGEKGYYRVYRGDGTCGVNMMASSSII